MYTPSLIPQIPKLVNGELDSVICEFQSLNDCDKLIKIMDGHDALEWLLLYVDNVSQVYFFQK